MKRFSLVLTAVILSFATFAQWKADPYHSKLGFTVTHLGIADVPGYFGKYDVTILSEKADFSDAVVEMTAEINSINTRVEPRDNHLKSADFFDAAKYPSMHFKSTSIKKKGNNK